MKLCLSLLSAIALVNADIVPVNYNGDPRFPSILKQCTSEAIRDHEKNAKRCSLFQIANVISQDAANKFKRLTKKLPQEVNLNEHMCTQCKLIFHDCTQAVFHIC